jgi:hypothetical protein
MTISTACDFQGILRGCFSAKTAISLPSTLRLFSLAVISAL